MRFHNAFFTLFIAFASISSSSLAIKKSYTVYLGGHAHGPDGSDLREVKDSHSEFLGSFLGSKERADEAIIYSYDKHINGFAANLDEEDAAKIAEHPDVASVFPNKMLKLHTTHSWDFLMLERNGVIHSSSLWKKARFGENTIIANLDTGVWPESKSFRDHGMGAIPKKWKGGCQNETLVPCNNKLIGAKYYNKGYLSGEGEVSDPEMYSPRDYEGHGSHTLSTAAGNFVKGVNINGIGNGTAKGGSPKARVASYKVCWPENKYGDGGCDESDMMAAFEAAIEDGVDVLSVSIGGEPIDYFEDSVAIASFHAVKKGVSVVCSAGNSGPDASTVTNVAPWVITVGANTIDRDFQSFAQLRNGLRLKGESLSKSLPDSRFYSLIDSADAKAQNASMEDAKLCMEGGLDPEKVKGKILVCLRGENARVDKGKQALKAGAAGMILCNDESTGSEIIADPHVLPATHITYSDGRLLYAYLNSTKDPLGFISNPVAKLNTKPAPYMASFSSRGPNSVTPEILKPDITAPGVNIIAAYSPAEEPEFSYNVDSGTSMACPHVSGVVGLLKTLHPDWSPSAIKSAIMTTARVRANTKNAIVDASTNEKADPFSYGSGQIRPNRAMEPGLVYDLSTNDYLDFLCALGYNETMIRSFSEGQYECPTNTTIFDFNYPSISVPKLSSSTPIKITRKLKNVGTPGVYTVRVRQPVGVSIDVEPKTLKFHKKGEEKSFLLTFKATKTSRRSSSSDDHRFGELRWSDGKHYVRSPIVVSLAS